MKLVDANRDLHRQCLDQCHPAQGAIGGLQADRRTMLLAMATGTGKTKLAIALLYRLLAIKRFRRICFVVDRSALGNQAAGEFTTTKIVSGKAFADIFGLKKLEDVTPDGVGPWGWTDLN
jgi:type I site-specific restriction endonuclease